MRKKVRFYRQHTMETCGISCILMLLDYYGKVQYPTKKQEGKLYSLYRSRAYKGVTAAAAAHCLSKNQLDVTLMHSYEEFYENKGDYFAQEMYCGLRQEYLQDIAACRTQIKLRPKKTIDLEVLRQALKAGKQVMLQCFIPGDVDGIHDHVLHWILLYGCQGDTFLACDPLISKIELTAKELEHYMDTPVGKVCLLIGR